MLDWNTERVPAILGIIFAAWLMFLIYLISTAAWIRVAIAVPIGIAILLLARSVSKGGFGFR